MSPIAIDVTDVACSLCGAQRGEQCKTPLGRKRFAHVLRAKAAYRAADAYNGLYNPQGRLGRPSGVING